jgi:hypothetical protein
VADGSRDALHDHRVRRIVGTTIVTRLIDAPRTVTSRVGVTGHRDVADTEAVRLECIAAVDRVRDQRGADIIEIWSSLAEGADRIAAHLVPEHAEQLIAILPLDPDDYRDDFVTDESRREFDELLAAADRVDISGPDRGATRESAYERAGLAIVEQCDVLLALWDGEPARGRGGTAEIVRAARERGRSVMHILVSRDDPT